MLHRRRPLSVLKFSRDSVKAQAGRCQVTMRLGVNTLVPGNKFPNHGPGFCVEVPEPRPAEQWDRLLSNSCNIYSVPCKVLIAWVASYRVIIYSPSCQGLCAAHQTVSSVR